MSYEDQLIRESTGEYDGRVWCSACERDDEDCICEAVSEMRAKWPSKWTVHQQGTRNLWELRCGPKLITTSTHFSMMRLIADAHNSTLPK